MPRYAAAVFYKDPKELYDLRKYTLEVIGKSTKKLDEEAGYRVDVLVNSEQIPILEEKGFRVKVIYDVDEIDKARQKDARRGD